MRQEDEHPAWPEEYEQVYELNARSKAKRKAGMPTEEVTASARKRARRS